MKIEIEEAKAAADHEQKQSISNNLDQLKQKI